MGIDAVLCSRAIPVSDIRGHARGYVTPPYNNLVLTGKWIHQSAILYIDHDEASAYDWSENYHKSLSQQAFPGMVLAASTPHSGDPEGTVRLCFCAANPIASMFGAYPIDLEPNERYTATPGKYTSDILQHACFYNVNKTYHTFHRQPHAEYFYSPSYPGVSFIVGTQKSYAGYFAPSFINSLGEIKRVTVDAMVTRTMTWYQDVTKGRFGTSDFPDVPYVNPYDSWGWRAVYLGVRIMTPHPVGSEFVMTYKIRTSDGVYHSGTGTTQTGAASTEVIILLDVDTYRMTPYASLVKRRNGSFSETNDGWADITCTAGDDVVYEPTIYPRTDLPCFYGANPDVTMPELYVLPSYLPESVIDESDVSQPAPEIDLFPSGDTVTLNPGVNQYFFYVEEDGLYGFHRPTNPNLPLKLIGHDPGGTPGAGPTDYDKVEYLRAGEMYITDYIAASEYVTEYADAVFFDIERVSISVGVSHSVVSSDAKNKSLHCFYQVPVTPGEIYKVSLTRSDGHHCLIRASSYSTEAAEVPKEMFGLNAAATLITAKTSTLYVHVPDPRWKSWCPTESGSPLLGPTQSGATLAVTLAT